MLIEICYSSSGQPTNVPLACPNGLSYLTFYFDNDNDYYFGFNGHYDHSLNRFVNIYGVPLPDCLRPSRFIQCNNSLFNDELNFLWSFQAKCFTKHLWKKL